MLNVGDPNFFVTGRRKHVFALRDAFRDSQTAVLSKAALQADVIMSRESRDSIERVRDQHVAWHTFVNSAYSSEESLTGVGAVGTRPPLGGCVVHVRHLMHPPGLYAAVVACPGPGPWVQSARHAGLCRWMEQGTVRCRVGWSLPGGWCPRTSAFPPNVWPAQKMR